MIIACDVDGVLNNLMDVVLDIYNTKYNASCTIKDVTSYNLEDCFEPEVADRIKDIFCMPGLLKKVKPVSGASNALQKLINAGVEVIRVGLCASENLSDEKTYFAGPNHSAIGELVENEIYYEKIKNQLLGFDLPIGDIIVYVPCGAVSKAVGQKRKNKLKLMASFGITDVVFKEKSGLLPYETRVERKNRCT